MNNKFENRLVESQMMRQQAIDYITAHPGALAVEVIMHCGWTHTSGSSRLNQMVKDGELSRVPAVCMVKTMYGQDRPQKTFAYTALIKETRTAVSVAQAIKDGTKRGQDVQARIKKDTRIACWNGGNYINNVQERKPQPCPDAMGSGHRRVFAGSSCSMMEVA